VYPTSDVADPLKAVEFTVEFTELLPSVITVVLAVNPGNEPI
jgi:hypothetical protein